MTGQLSSTTIPRVSLSTVTCELCQTAQPAPDADSSNWRCRKCGQQYRGGTATSGPAIILNSRQLTALRNLAGRDTSGKTTLVPNWWTQNETTTGEGFLDYNKDAPSRAYTRKLITDWATGGQISSVLEIAFGGLHEYRALRDQLKNLNVSYSGIDWTEKFVEHAQQEFPESRWIHGDIVRGVTAEPADVVYSQHMLEHIPALEPAFSNMLRLANKKLINIFFIPPKPFPNYEVVNWQYYPLYHNTYSIGHIEAVCKANGFSCKWMPFTNPVDPQKKALGEDVVLIAEKTTI